MAQGYLQVDVVSDANNFPVGGASVSIAHTESPGEVLETMTTNSSGQTENVMLEAPPLEYSLQPSEERPYAEYTIRVAAPGYEPLVISGTEILADATAIQGARLTPLAMEEEGSEEESVVIPDHTLYGTYPPKIAESEVKPVDESGEIVPAIVSEELWEQANEVLQTIVVHDGVPSNASAQNYYVPYRDYIKNVASSEIYATWPQSTIVANVLAIMSFTLNRVYTEWYRNQGYDFTITSSTAYDHKWIYGRNIYESISVVVDDIFDNYLSRPDVKQPVLTQYCDGRKVSCPGWMTQWGSCDLGERGYSPIEILRYFYGNDMYVNTAEQISGIPASWPGSNLTVGSRGEKVRQGQEQLAARPVVDGQHLYGSSTYQCRRNLRSCHGKSGKDVPVDLRPSGNGCRGFCHLV